MSWGGGGGGGGGGVSRGKGLIRFLGSQTKGLIEGRGLNSGNVV